MRLWRPSGGSSGPESAANTGDTGGRRIWRSEPFSGEAAEGGWQRGDGRALAWPLMAAAYFLCSLRSTLRLRLRWKHRRRKTKVRFAARMHPKPRVRLRPSGADDSVVSWWSPSYGQGQELELTSLPFELRLIDAK